MLSSLLLYPNAQRILLNIAFERFSLGNFPFTGKLLSNISKRIISSVVGLFVDPHMMPSRIVRHSKFQWSQIRVFTIIQKSPGTGKEIGAVYHGKEIPAKMAVLQEGVEHLLAISSSVSKSHIAPLCSAIAKR